MNLAPIWTICAQSPPPVCRKDHPYLKRSGATPGSKSGSRTVTGLVGGLRARSAVRCGDLEFGMAALAEPEGSLWRFTMGPGCGEPGGALRVTARLPRRPARPGRNRGCRGRGSARRSPHRRRRSAPDPRRLPDPDGPGRQHQEWFVASRPRPPGLTGPAVCAREPGGVSRRGGLVSQP